MNALSKFMVAASPVAAVVALYILFGYLDILGWIRLALSASMGLVSANFAQAATVSSLAGTSLYRSKAMRSFGIDVVASLVAAIPISMALHARIIHLGYGWPAVFSSASWAPWLNRDGGVATLFVTLVFCIGFASLLRLFRNRLTRH
jgi:hypothetical protein